MNGKFPPRCTFENVSENVRQKGAVTSQRKMTAFQALFRQKLPSVGREGMLLLLLCTGKAAVKLHGAETPSKKRNKNPRFFLSSTLCSF